MTSINCILKYINSYKKCHDIIVVTVFLIKYMEGCRTLYFFLKYILNVQPSLDHPDNKSLIKERCFTVCSVLMHMHRLYSNPTADHWALVSGLPTYVAENGLVRV